MGNASPQCREELMWALSFAGKGAAWERHSKAGASFFLPQCRPDLCLAAHGAHPCWGQVIRLAVLSSRRKLWCRAGRGREKTRSLSSHN